MSALQDFEAYHTPESVRQEFLSDDEIETWKRKHKGTHLDKPSAMRPVLRFSMEEVLLRISLTSDGAVAALKQRVKGTKDPSAPKSDLEALVADLDKRFYEAKTDVARLLILNEARRTLILLQFAPDRSKVRGTPEWRQAIISDPRSCRVLAGVWGVGKDTIARIKKTKA